MWAQMSGWAYNLLFLESYKDNLHLKKKERKNSKSALTNVILDNKGTHVKTEIYIYIYVYWQSLQRF